MAYTSSQASDLQNIITNLDTNTIIKYHYCSYIQLCDNCSLFIKASKDDKENWPYNIYENSRYGTFALHNDGKMELISRGLKMPKFRKCKVKNLEEIAEKLIKYFEVVE